MESIFKRGMPWLGDEFGMKDVPSSIFPGLSLVQWMSMQQNNQFPGVQSGFFPSMVSASALHGGLAADDPSKLLNFQAPSLSVPNVQFNKASQQTQMGPLQQQCAAWSQQQQLPQILQNPVTSQQHQQQQLLQKEQLQPQQSQMPLEKQQIPQSTFVSSGIVTASNKNLNHNSQQPSTYTQVHQQQSLAGNNQVQQNVPLNKGSVPLASLPPHMQFQQQD